MTILLELLVAALVLGGAFFMLVAALGILRLPDLILRMHAATKAGALGAGLLLTAVAVFYGDSGVTVRALAGILFLLLTAPVASHAIGRAAYFQGIALWDRTAVDQLRGRYDPQAERLAGLDEPAAAPTAAPPTR